MNEQTQPSNTDRCPRCMGHASVPVTWQENLGAGRLEWVIGARRECPECKGTGEAVRRIVVPAIDTPRE